MMDIFKLSKYIAIIFHEYLAEIGPSLSDQVSIFIENIYGYRETMIKDSMFLTGITECYVLSS